MDVEAFADAVGAAGAWGEAAGAAALGGGGLEGATGEDALAAAGAWPTVTSGVILPIVAEETPAFDRSLTEE